MTSTDTSAERHRLQMALYDLASAAYYLSRLPGDEAAAIRREVLALVVRCQALVQTMVAGEDA
jgi:hypothetical protein